MVRKGEILSQAVSGIGDDLIEGAKELFEKSESEITQAQNEFAKKSVRCEISLYMLFQRQRQQHVFLLYLV